MPQMGQLSIPIVPKGAIGMDRDARDRCQMPDVSCGRWQRHTPAGKAMKAVPFSSSGIMKASDADLIASTENGKGKMPAFKGKITDSQIKDLIAYIRTINITTVSNRRWVQPQLSIPANLCSSSGSNNRHHCQWETRGRSLIPFADLTETASPGFEESSVFLIDQKLIGLISLGRTSAIVAFGSTANQDAVGSSHKSAAWIKAMAESHAPSALADLSLPGGLRHPSRHVAANPETTLLTEYEVGGRNQAQPALPKVSIKNNVGERAAVHLPETIYAGPKDHGDGESSFRWHDGFEIAADHIGQFADGITDIFIYFCWPLNCHHSFGECEREWNAAFDENGPIPCH